MCVNDTQFRFDSVDYGPLFYSAFRAVCFYLSWERKKNMIKDFSRMFLLKAFTELLCCCLDEGNEEIPVSSPEDSSVQPWEGKVSSSENGLESKEVLDKNTLPTSPSSEEPKEIKLESTNTIGISLRSKLIPFAPFLETHSYTPPVSDQPFEPPSDSADDNSSGGSRSSTAEGRPMSPDSVVSAAPANSPSPPLTPSSAARKMFDFKGGAASSQSRRQWGVTDKVMVLFLVMLEI